MKRRIAIMTCIAMLFTLIPTYAMAADNKSNNSTSLNETQKVQLQEKKATPLLKGEGKVTKQIDKAFLDKSMVNLKKSVYWDEEYQWIYIERPKWDEVIYQGEKLYTDYMQLDTWEEWYTIPVEVLWNSDDEIEFYREYNDAFVDPDVGYTNWSGPVNINSKKLAPGYYDFWVLNAPADEYGNIPSNWVDEFDVPYDYNRIHIKKFKAPTNLKVTAGKKKVTVTFKGSTGATKYKIYRSTKKSSGYKLIKTTTKKKYVDKKVKAGKRYYYKVKAVRKAAKKNQIVSKFTAPKRCKKVKR